MLSAVIFWLLVGLQTLGVLCTIAIIDKERKPITHRFAVINVLVAALFVLGYFYLWHH